MTKNPSSIFHFFVLLVKNRKTLCGNEKIANLPFIANNKKMMLFSEQKNTFPDMALNVATGYPEDSDIFQQSGALIELKDSTTSYTVTPFNSTIPFGIKKDVTAKGAKVGKKIKDDPNVDKLKTRHVYYLARGRNTEKKNVPQGEIQKTKICLVHGSFFEPKSVKDLIFSSFLQVLNEAGTKINTRQKENLCNSLNRQKLFSAYRHQERKEGYLSLQFRILVKTNTHGNILRHPKIEDDTLNFIIPLLGKSKQARKEKACAICKIMKKEDVLKDISNSFFIKRPLKGYFWVLQVPLR